MLNSTGIYVAIRKQAEKIAKQNNKQNETIARGERAQRKIYNRLTVGTVSGSFVPDVVRQQQQPRENELAPPLYSHGKKKHLHSSS